MKLTKVTITGADDNTSIDEMFSLSEKYPFIEWGILFSPARNSEKQERYPSYNFMLVLNHAVNNYPRVLNLSAHLCGGYTKEIIEHGTGNLIKKDLGEYMPMFDRWQLNFNASKAIFNPEKFRNFLYGTDKPVIIQYNEANKMACQNAKMLPPHKQIHFLYDNSGGNGITPAQWYPPSRKHYTGYAGGLNPDNIAAELEKTNKVCKPNDEIWVDAESGLRTNGKLDMTKVESFVKNCLPYVPENLK